jgi:hypothetical protein
LEKEQGGKDGEKGKAALIEPVLNMRYPCENIEPEKVIELG